MTVPKHARAHLVVLGKQHYNVHQLFLLEWHSDRALQNGVALRCAVLAADQTQSVLHVLQTMVEVVNMLPPPYMLPQKAPKPPAQLRCAVTGRPAKYRDPSSGYGYADLDAYKELKQRLQSERRGLTGRRTKRQSSKLPRQDAESDPAQLATGAAQADAAAAPDAQASEPRDLITVQMQPATDGKAAEPFGVAVSSETAPPPAAAAPETVVMSDQRLAAAAPAGPAGTAQSQPSVTTVPMPVVSTAAAATEAVTSALLAQQGSQQSLVSANAAAAGPGSGASAPSGTADMLTASAAVTSVALPPATSKALASPAGKHGCITCTASVLLAVCRETVALFCSRCLPLVIPA